MINELNRKWWILAAMTTSISMIFVDITVLPVVLPTLQRELDISNLGLQWVINAYTLVLAVLVLAGGRIGDILGLKRAFCIGITCFAIASALCGLSSTAWWMIMSRALQGIGGALMLPATQGIVIAHFPPQQRGKAMGLFVSIGSIFLALGPLIGGSLTTYLSWHYVFWINLPIAAIGLIMTWFVVPFMKGKKESLDLRGFIIQAIGLCCVVVALMQAQKWDWQWTAGLLILGSGFLYYLFHRKDKAHARIFDFELIKKKSFRSSCGCVFLNQLIIMVTVFWAIYFQNILGFSPAKAGFYAFIANIPVLFAAPLGGMLVDRFGPRLPVMIGFGLITFSLTWFSLSIRHENIWLLMPTLVTFGFGVSMIFTPSFVSMMNEIPPEKRGSASGINSALRQFSSTLGLALFGTLYSLIYLNTLGKSFLDVPNLSSLSPKPFEGLLSQSPDAMDHLNLLSKQEAMYVLQSAKAAFLHAFTWLNVVGACFALMGVLIARRFLGNQPMKSS
jgi:EmrB/QacA subfamily drug resistance transporter